MPYLDVELEAYFDYWLTAGVKNQNFGIMVWPPEKEGTLKVTGFSYKASSVSPVTKEIQGKIFQMVGTGADEEEVTSFIRPIALPLHHADCALSSVSPSNRGADMWRAEPRTAHWSCGLSTAMRKAEKIAGKMHVRGKK